MPPSDANQYSPEKAAFQQALLKVRQLVENFHSGRQTFLSSDYSEAQARKDFIDKFWIALGWDVNHERQLNPYEQEVKVERGGFSGAERGRRADYAFLASNFRDVRFFVEAKRPGVDIDNPGDYFQLVRYGWNSHAPLSVLTNFAQFRVLDCRFRPDIDSALHRSIKELSFAYAQYTDQDDFARIYFLFSREAVAGGSLERYAHDLPRPTGKAVQRGLFPSARVQPMDETFLEELDTFREDLAKNFKRRNPRLGSEELTEATQRTLDRLVFMRFLEDKLIESDPLVENLGSRGSVWQDFVATSRRLDRLYNGIIFKEHPVLDSAGFKVDEGVFEAIRERLAHTNSPYAFHYIPIHILGSIYERFLGKTIISTDKTARVEDKPEVRKAGGVYYTPEYIVRYIVQNTVGQLVADKSPEEIAGMRFADIACGSGSFLLGIYDTLLRRHASFYNFKKNRTLAKKNGCVEGDDGLLHLSLRQKRQILLNSVFGVDLDPQAVEVAQLSLYLKLLEEETVASARHYQMEFGETLLPSLSGNVVCGNSLIEWDVADGSLFDSEEERHLRPLDFAAAFPFLRVSGGFDAVVGNPPYVRIQGFPRRQVEYLKRKYEVATGNYDLYVNFIQRAYELLSIDGRLGQIVPNKFFKTDYGSGLRKFISRRSALHTIVDFGADQVFPATTYTCLLFLTKNGASNFSYCRAPAEPNALPSLQFRTLTAESLSDAGWDFDNDECVKNIRHKLWKHSKRLLDLPASMSRGSSTGDDKSFLVPASGHGVEAGILRIPLFATGFGRYEFRPDNEHRIIFPYEVSANGVQMLRETALRDRFPNAYRLLVNRKSHLKARKQYASWYGYSAPRNLALHEKAQIVGPLLADRGLFALIPSSFSGKICPMASGGFTIAIDPKCGLNPKYVLGLLNSRLLFWVLKRISNVFRGGW